ncbi:hypothetical protein MMC16_001771 [Acarospora aff. strigata]|nr:hypothetical protein [Acarospora aff. strigata]
MDDDTPDTQEGKELETIASPTTSDAAIFDLPQSKDTLTTFCYKLTAVADVITAGKSVAVATGYAAITNQEQRPVQKATAEMTPSESDAWTWFKTGSYTLPDLDWNTSVDPKPLSAKPLKTARRRAEALNRLYKTDQAQPAHSVWFTKHHLVHLDLVKAMARVIGAERDLVGGGVWTATQLADLQSINKILAVTAQFVNGRGSQPLLPAIARAQAVVVTRRDALRNQIVGRKRKRGSLAGYELAVSLGILVVQPPTEVRGPWKSSEKGERAAGSGGRQ